MILWALVWRLAVLMQSTACANHLHKDAHLRDSRSSAAQSKAAKAKAKAEKEGGHH